MMEKEIYYHDLNVPSILTDIHLEAKEKGINWSLLDDLNYLKEVNLENSLLIINPTYTEIKYHSDLLKDVLDYNQKVNIIFVATSHKKKELVDKFQKDYSNIQFFCQEGECGEVDYQKLKKTLLEELANE